jgi:hypothetical protein
MLGPEDGIVKKLAFLWLVICASAVLAQDKPSFVGDWKLDVSQSDFGSEPAPKSMAATTKIDTPQMLSYRLHGVDDKGKAFSYSWSGPQDGSMHPFMVNGKPAGRQGVKREQDTLVRHGDDSSDGSSFDARTQLSADGNTITDETTDTSKDGKVTKQKAVWHRVK